MSQNTLAGGSPVADPKQMDKGALIHRGADVSDASSRRLPTVATGGRTERTLTEAEAKAAAARIRLLTDNIERALFGKREVVEIVLVGLLARGHILVEDVPGVGKTALARALARSLDCEFRRIQFTPDLLPSDVTGVSVFDQQAGRFRFHPGPLFAHVVLADEINRTTPRTQAALLEAMNDFQVSVDGVTHALPSPFIVLATQNPLEYAGTYPLPEAQLDRFLLRLSVGYPSREAERNILQRHRAVQPLDVLQPVLTAAEVAVLQETVRAVMLAEPLTDYILEIAARTRAARDLALGVSPRGCLMLYRAAQARALLDGRAFCIPDDVKTLALPVLAHRLIEKGRDSASGGGNAAVILRDIVEETPVPV
jgi:MoxR-like ATPase